MTTPRKTPNRQGARSRAKKPAADLQPQATGANRGSPAAPVMKQFAKTRAESSGRS
ncbi:MAG TPA: hypothetical protein VGD76_00915 [Ramlibacter sp.]